MDTYFVVDVESDGPIIGKNSMVCFGAIKLDRLLNTTFYGQTKPISDNYDKEALAISGFSRAEHLEFDNPQEVFLKFRDWIEENSEGRPVLISDNNGYDASWINFYFLDQIGENPFGWSSRRIGDWFAGFYNNTNFKWKKFRKTKHSHNPVDDARGNAEAVLYLIDEGFNLWE